MEISERKKLERTYKRRVLQRYKTIKGCTSCGYRKNAAALQFDHRDPTTKEITIAAATHRWSLRKLATEVAKCDVLCANCHAEKTHGQTTTIRPAIYRRRRARRSNVS